MHQADREGVCADGVPNVKRGLAWAARRWLLALALDR